MTDNLDNRTFKIISLSDANLPIGVNDTRVASQRVYINAPVHDWTFRKVDGNKYRLSINGYHYTGVHERKVIASTEREHEAEWIIVRHEYQNAFTIALASDPHLGWTVPLNDERHREIGINPIRETHSIPPHFLPTQLFSLRAPESD